MVWTLGQSDRRSATYRRPSGRSGATREPPESMAKPSRSLARRNRPTSQAARRTADQALPPTTGPASLDTQARHDGEAAAGHSGGARPDGGSGTEARARTDLRARFRRARATGFDPDADAAKRCKRVEELLSQGHAWCVDLDFKSYFDTIPHERLLGLVQAARRGRERPGVAGAKLESWRAGRAERLAADRARHSARSGHQSVCWRTCISTRWTTNGRAGLGDGALCG